MARISPAAPEQFAQVADTMERWKSTKGYPPNSWLTMVRKPRVFRAYRELHTAVMMDEGEVPGSLKFLVACVVSMAAGDMTIPALVFVFAPIVLWRERRG